jgi:hypothetical protein
MRKGKANKKDQSDDSGSKGVQGGDEAGNRARRGTVSPFTNVSAQIIRPNRESLTVTLINNHDMCLYLLNESTWWESEIMDYPKIIGRVISETHELPL